jgi:deoxyribodipyrimidine photo-lyase
MDLMMFEPTREAGLDRLAKFVAFAGRHYQNNRNADLGPDDRSNVSALSPYIRHRLITEEEVLRAVLAKHSPAAAEKFIQEVFWRTYFKGHLETRPVIWANYRAALTTIKMQGGLQKAYDAAVNAQTGIDCFDAWVSELVERGYLHNHARMWFASIWIFTLKLPCELGADFMYRHLLDGDPASNTLSWRWVAGLHTKGKTYLARAHNIETYTQGRFLPRGLTHEAVALEEPDLPKAQKIPAASEQFSGADVGLLLSEDDLHVESWNLKDVRVVAIAGAHCVDKRSAMPVSQLVKTFVDGALDDGLSRAASHFSAPSERLNSFAFDDVMAWAQKHRLTTIVTAYAPVGPVAEQLTLLEPALKAQGIDLVQLRRRYDSSAWPHGTKGFFAMKEKIPEFVQFFARSDDPQMSLL